MAKYALAHYHSRRRWTAAEARDVLAALDASGLSASQFATRKGVDVQRIYWWRRRLREQAAPAFVELTTRGAQHVEVVLRSGRVLRVAESIDSEVLRRFVDVLDEEAAC